MRGGVLMIWLATTLAVISGSPARAQLVGSKHNLSASGPGAVRAFGEDEVCVFCHAPHARRPQTPLWNHEMPNLSYKLYSSSTITAEPGQPTGSSKLCLSCHDGTIALGQVPSRPEGRVAGMSGVMLGRSNLETDLSDDHPISFIYDASITAQNPEIVDPRLLGPDSIRLENGQMQCTTCHDPHSSPTPSFSSPTTPTQNSASSATTRSAGPAPATRPPGPAGPGWESIPGRTRSGTASPRPAVRTATRPTRQAIPSDCWSSRPRKATAWPVTTGALHRPTLPES